MANQFINDFTKVAYISENNHKVLKKYCADNGMKLSYLINEIIENWVKEDIKKKEE